jgi:hypothetical protein
MRGPFLCALFASLFFGQHVAKPGELWWLYILKQSGLGVFQCNMLGFGYA